MVNVAVKRLDSKATLPQMAKNGDACFDLVAISFEQNVSVITVGTGLAFAIPPGYEGQVRSRSGLASKGVFVTPGIGTIDSGYRGEVKVFLSAVDGVPFIGQFGKSLKIGGAELRIGDRVAQLAIREVPPVTLIPVENLDETERGEGGFGSTGQ